ncbi:MAG: hypothetical protein A2638_02810 [Nitrospirae bacterium RIFCSPHIGHO2_01_FULL_66_17]|nr:MAG: hypothetical protein A2638_02810 [Nitrospirae bacterium RIFCSPHIGHO2_01_FULL_66_17]
MTRPHRNGILGWLGWFLCSLTVVTAAPATSHAGGTIKIDDSHSVSVGMGVRSSFNMVENGAPNGTDWSNDFVLNSVRLYLGGQLHNLVTFEFNTDYDPLPAGTEDIRVLDAVVKLGLSDTVNVWAGRFLPPSDRSNLSGPYYLNAWDFPFVQQYPAVFAGRDDGVALWGQTGGGRFKYQAGAFEGQGDTATGPNQNDALLFAGRLTLNLWDPEPGYYNSSTYYGAKNVLALGLVAMTQDGASGTAAASGDFTGWNVDVLMEKNLGASGVPTLEGAYYNYDRDGLGAAGAEGHGYFALASYLLPGKVGPKKLQGRVQPMVRYQNFENKGGATGKHTRTDLGVSYVIDGHNARLTANYGMDNPATGPDFNLFRLGVQFQL